jgi:hypothetical protein
MAPPENSKWNLLVRNAEQSLPTSDYRETADPYQEGTKVAWIFLVIFAAFGEVYLSSQGFSVGGLIGILFCALFTVFWFSYISHDLLHFSRKYRLLKQALEAGEEGISRDS